MTDYGHYQVLDRCCVCVYDKISNWGNGYIENLIEN